MIDPKDILQMSSDLESAKKAKEAAKIQYDRIDVDNLTKIAILQKRYDRLKTSYERLKRSEPGSQQLASLEINMSRIHSDMDTLNGEISVAMIDSSRASTKYLSLLKDFNEKTKSAEEGKGA